MCTEKILKFKQNLNLEKEKGPAAGKKMDPASWADLGLLAQVPIQGGRQPTREGRLLLL